MDEVKVDDNFKSTSEVFVKDDAIRALCGCTLGIIAVVLVIVLCCIFGQ